MAGAALFKGLPIITELNGLAVGDLRKDRDNDHLIFQQRQLRTPELGIVCGLIAEMLYYNVTIRKVDLSRNLLDCECLHKLVDCLIVTACVQELDISYNPVTNNGTDLSGVQRLQEFVSSSKQVLVVGINGISAVGVPAAPPVPASTIKAAKKHGIYYSIDHSLKWYELFLTQ